MDRTEFEKMGKPFDLNKVELDNDRKIDEAVQGLKQVDYDSEAVARETARLLGLSGVESVINKIKTELDIAYIHGQMQVVKAKMNDLRGK